MLVQLHIEDFAIIDRLDVELKSSLVTFTGETGAGKSIIIDAVETILGGRADATQVRTDAQRANVEALFQIPESLQPHLHAILRREELLDQPDMLSMGREIRSNGRSIARVNGRVVNVSLLREIGELLVDVHGQSDHLSLLKVNQHLGLLDRFASTDPQNPLKDLLPKYQLAYHRLQTVDHEIQRIHQAEQDAARRTDMLRYQINEILSAHLTTGEEEELLGERNRLSNSEVISSLVQSSLVALDEGTPESPSASDLIGQAVTGLTSLARYDPSQEAMRDQFGTLFESLSDLIHTLRLYLEGIEFNPRRLDQVEERLALIHSLKRKYGETDEAILDYAQEAQNQLEEISTSADRLLELEKERESLVETLGETGWALSQARHSAARELERLVETELQELQMSGARFQVSFLQVPDPQGVPIPGGTLMAYYPQGLEKTEFLIAPNPGEGFKPLVKIASGGETSRLMLALKNVLIQADHIPTLIFDEIDQGIGGRVGSVVGLKLKHLGQKHQVLCITHLPQLAAFGTQHLHVEKQLADGRTSTRIKDLKGEERLIELAQMLGNLSQSTLQSARELLSQAE